MMKFFKFLISTIFSILYAKTRNLTFVAIMFKLALKCHNRPRVTCFIQKYYTMHCSVRLHGQNACYVIFWNIAPQHWIYRGYCKQRKLNLLFFAFKGVKPLINFY
jgi:hypothetical protein